ncbi:MAG: prepilin-type N-terminal cleavage/methylation domain-containing protein [Syntrophobacteraceae bacterium]
MKESKGFTLVELMIVVAIIGILAAVAVPFYQKYIQKSRMTSKVFPGMHAIETNVATFYSFQQKLDITDATFQEYIKDADTTCFTPSWSTASGLKIVIKGSDVCKPLASLAGKVICGLPQVTDNKITGWKLSGDLAIQLGLEGEK